MTGVCRKPLPHVRVVSNASDYSKHRGGDASTPNCSISLTLLHDAEGLRTGHEYPLTGEMFQRSLVHAGDSRIRRVIALASRNETIRVMTIGGSVARGATTHAKSTFPSSARFASWLRLRYPHARIVYHNVGVRGTTSAWLALAFDSLGRAHPDLVLWDYSTNDLTEGATMSQLRISFERLARLLLQMPTRPAVLFLMLMRNLDEPSTYWVQAEAVEPIAKLYGLVLVSYRDAVWPAVDRPPSNLSHLYDTHKREGFPYHPTSWTHQLIADCLCYAWAAIEHVQPLNASETASALPPAAFFRARADVLAPCDGGWKTELRFHRMTDDESLRIPQPIDKPDGWRYVADQPYKEGWQFDARNATGTTDLRSTPGSSLAGLLEPLKFRMSFGEDPRLLVTYLRSYENFGRALVWVDEHAQDALHRVHVNDCYNEKCALAFPWLLRTAVANQSLVRASMARCSGMEASSRNASDVLQSLNRVQNTAGHGCLRQLGGLEPPLVLNGWWSDHSSQMHSDGFEHSFTLSSTNTLNDDAIFVENESLPLVRGAARTGRVVERTVSLAMLTDVGVVAGFTGARLETRPRFKLLSLRSC